MVSRREERRLVCLAAMALLVVCGTTGAAGAEAHAPAASDGTSDAHTKWARTNISYVDARHMVGVNLDRSGPGGAGDGWAVSSTGRYAVIPIVHTVFQRHPDYWIWKDRGTGQTVTLDRDNLQAVGGISPDGAVLSYQLDGPTSGGLDLINVPDPTNSAHIEAPEELSAGCTYDASLSATLTADGNRVVFDNGNPGCEYREVVLDLNSGHTYAHADSDSFAAAISADGTNVLVYGYRDHRDYLEIWRPDTGEVVPLSVPVPTWATDSFFQPYWGMSPNGQWVFSRHDLYSKQRGQKARYFRWSVTGDDVNRTLVDIRTPSSAETYGLAAANDGVVYYNSTRTDFTSTTDSRYSSDLFSVSPTGVTERLTLREGIDEFRPLATDAPKFAFDSYKKHSPKDRNGGWDLFILQPKK